MSLAEGVSARVAYKFYPTGVINANALDNSATLPGGATGGQILRRVGVTTTLKKNTYQSAEIRSDRQVADYRHGTAHVEGNLTGELSPATYFDFFEAVHRDTRAGPLSILPATLTSVVASNAASSFTFGSGDPVAAGLMIGDLVTFTGMTTAADNAAYYLVLGFSGTGNATMLVSPAPADQLTPDTGFTLVRPGHATTVPSTGQVRRKVFLEVYDSDIGIARCFLENRLSMYHVVIPATGMTTCEFGVYGRAALSLTGGAAPYFAAPAAITTTGVCASVNGALLFGGVQIGVITSLDLTMNLAPTAADVIGQNFAAEIFLGTETLTGSMAAFLSDTTLLAGFDNETEFELLLKVSASAAANASAITIYLPRVKLGSADINWAGVGGQTITTSLMGLKYSGATPGKVNSTIRIMDTDA